MQILHLRLEHVLEPHPADQDVCQADGVLKPHVVEETRSAEVALDEADRGAGLSDGQSEVGRGCALALAGTDDVIKMTRGWSSVSR